MEPAPASAVAPPARSPWLWVPSLYFSQGIPYVIVMTMSVIMYKRLGVSNTDIGLYTSWLYLPWVLKPLWSPLVDITRTKRFWVVTMQFFIAAGLALVAGAVAAPSFFRLTLALFWVMALASATHDIAADGFYMLSMSKHEQAWWVGLRSTFYRTAMIVGSGLLVVLAGVLESKNGLPSAAIPIHAVLAITPQPTRPVPLTAPQSGPLQLIMLPAAVNIALTNASADQAKAAITDAKTWNQQHHFLTAEKPVVKENGAGGGDTIFQPLSRFLRARFPRNDTVAPVQAGNVGTFWVTLSRPPPPGRRVPVHLEQARSGLEYFGLGRGDHGFRLMTGEQLTFDQDNWNQPAAVVVQLDPKLQRETTVNLTATSGNIPVAWSITLFTVAGLFLLFSLWHSAMLPRPAQDGPVVGNRGLAAEFFTTFAAFFKKPGLGLALAFILFYRFDEAQLGKVISPFLLDARSLGGLALTTSQVGLAYGTFGIAALTCGGLAGGFAAARYGLKTMLPIMVGSMYLPKLAFVFLSYTQPENFLAVCATVAVEQFGYGFGFTAFMLYLLYFADGPHKTAHYAICTGFMALGMLIPGLWSGWLADQVGYRHFFVWVIISALPGLIIALRLKIDPQFGKKITSAQ